MPSLSDPLSHDAGVALLLDVCSGSRFVTEVPSTERLRASGADPSAADSNGVSRRLVFNSLAEWQASYTAPRWLIRNFLMHDAFDVFGGAEKSLKSWLMHHCAIAVAAGVPLFMVDDMDVPEPGIVLLLTGEGGVDLVQDRIRHLCEGMYGVAFDDIAERIVVSADIAPMTSRSFATDVTEAIARWNPVLFQLDPLYVYFGEDREAGNVFSTGPALMTLRRLTAGRAHQSAHHFTKAAADRLTLSSLTQAGMREAVDHWLLIAVDEYDLAAQRFELRLERGARRGLAWSKRAEVVLGPFDPTTLLHSGVPSVTLSSESSASGKATDPKTAGHLRACAVLATRAAEEQMHEDLAAGREVQGIPKRVLMARINRRCGTDVKLAGIEEAALKGSLRTVPGPRGALLHFYVKDFPT